MSVKTLASPGNPSGPAALLTCLKVLLTPAMESLITQSSRRAGALMQGGSCSS